MYNIMRLLDNDFSFCASRRSSLASLGARARWAGLGKLLGRAWGLPNGPQLASLKPGPDGLARAGFWVGAQACLPNADTDASAKIVWI